MEEALENEDKDEKSKDDTETDLSSKIRSKIIENNVRVDTQEIGPRMVLQLRKFYSTVFDTVNGKYEYAYRADYYVKRNNIFL